MGARERALGQRLRDRGSARGARVGVCRAPDRATRLPHRSGDRPLSAACAATRRRARRNRRAVRQRPARAVGAPAMITTDRLLIRKPRREDAADLTAAYSDPEVMRFMGDGSTATIAEVEDGIGQWLERWDSWGLSLCSL